MANINLNINPYTFTGSAFFIGLILANELDPLEQATIGNWLQLAGMTIQTYASQVALVESNNNSNSSTNTQPDDSEIDETIFDDLDTIKKAITKINEELDKLNKK